MGIKPHVLYFKAGEGYDLSPENPVQRLAASLAFAGARLENPDKSPWARAKRKIGYLFGVEQYYPFSYQYDAINANKIILEHAKKVKADIVILRSFWCHYIPILQKEGFKIIVNCLDYNTRLAIEMIGSVKNPLRKIGPLCNYIGIRRQERTFLPLCDELWIPTKSEFEEMTKVVLKGKMVIFPNLIDVKSYPDFSEKDVEKFSILFVANFDYLPNANAANNLLKNIFPGVKRRFPSAKLYLIGKGLPVPLQELALKTGGIEVPGFVKDLKEYFEKAAVFVSPVNEGAGMLFKVLEALSYGKPVVGFKKSFRGITDANGQGFFAVDSVEEFINKIVALMVSDEKRNLLAHNARKIAEQELSFEKGRSILERSIVNINRCMSDNKLINDKL
jgi:glycosyltransferase involved in cell wall biosynthesis